MSKPTHIAYVVERPRKAATASSVARDRSRLAAQKRQRLRRRDLRANQRLGRIICTERKEKSAGAGRRIGRKVTPAGASSAGFSSSKPIWRITSSTFGKTVS